VEGGADKSYGIQVARLAGLPQAVIRRAKEVLANLESAEFNELGEPVAASNIRAGEDAIGRTVGRTGKPGASGEAEGSEPQLGLFANQAGLLFREIAGLNLDGMTPLDAMNKLYELKKKAGNG
jgi:DNA mismatch repair protein MutS